MTMNFLSVSNAFLEAKTKHVDKTVVRSAQVGGINVLSVTWPVTGLIPPTAFSGNNQPLTINKVVTSIARTLPPPETLKNSLLHVINTNKATSY